MSHDIYEDAARALVGFDARREAVRLRFGIATRLARAADAVSDVAAALRDAFVRGLALAACAHAAAPFDSLTQRADRR